MTEDNDKVAISVTYKPIADCIDCIRPTIKKATGDDWLPAVLAIVAEACEVQELKESEHDLLRKSSLRLAIEFYNELRHVRKMDVFNSKKQLGETGKNWGNEGRSGVHVYGQLTERRRAAIERLMRMALRHGTTRSGG